MDRRRTRQRIPARPAPGRHVTGHTAELASLGMLALSEHVLARAPDDLQPVMEEATRLVAGVLGVELAAILEIGPDGDRTLRRAWVEGRSSPRPAIVDEVAGMASYTLSVMKPVVSADLTKETRFRPATACADWGVASALSVPIRALERADVTYGVLLAGSRAPRAFDRAEVDFVAGVSNVVGAAIHRRQMEEQLRATKERLDLLCDAIRDGAMVALDPHGSVAEWSAPAERLFRRRAEAVIGEHFSGLVAAEDTLRGSVEELVQTAVRDGHVEGRASLVRGDGSRFAAGIDLYVLRGQGTALLGFSLVVRDLTARVEVEAAVAEIEHQRDVLEAVIDQFPAGLIIADDPPVGRVVRVSKNFDALHVRPMTPGSSLADFTVYSPAFYPDGRRLRRDDFAGARALRGETVRQEVVLERHDGTRITVLDISAPIRDRDGRVTGCVAGVYDVSEEKAAALERERLLDETRRAVRARDDVLAIVSHDLRNHLAVVVLAAAQLTKREEVVGVPAIAEFVRQIGGAASGMQQIIEDLLDVARIEAGQLRVEPADQEIAEVVHGAVDTFAALAAEHGIELRASLGALAGARISCDRSRVVQALSNLIGNALKFVPPGRGVEVGGLRGERDVVVFVKDEGPGLRPEELPHVFERHWQAWRTGAKGGLGLGLAIVKGIVEAHGGRVWAESPPGQGATFSFSLPLAAAA